MCQSKHNNIMAYLMAMISHTHNTGGLGDSKPIALPVLLFMDIRMNMLRGIRKLESAQSQQVEDVACRIA